MNKILISAPAKINLCLDVLNRLDNGYHNIESIMQTISLFDILDLEKFLPSGNEQTIYLSCTDDTLPCDKKNLSYRAAEAFFEVCGISYYHVKIHINKNIPIAAGLAGGSTDAAATLLGLNQLFNANLPIGTLCNIGSTLGADVPFCIMKGTVITEGIGDVFSDCPQMPYCPIVIALDGECVSTPWAYGKLDELPLNMHTHTYVDTMKVAIESKVINNIVAQLYNIFEKVILPYHKEASNIKKIMLENGALGALMSGSGPAVFGIFDTMANAEFVMNQLDDKGIKSFLCKPC